MPITDLIPWKRNEGRGLTVRRRDDPILAIQEEMNRLFDDFITDPFAMNPSRALRTFGGSFIPSIDVSESEKEVTVTAEIPGMDENDIQVSFNQGTLAIYGEKQDEKEEKDRRFHRVERSFGSFRREIAMPCEVEGDKITATFKKGVLTVVLPKSSRSEVLGKRIQVTRG
jgi:HSP20 family protein